MMYIMQKCKKYVPLCTPHIRADTVVEIDMGTQVITHSPNAIHFAAHIVAIYRYLVSGSRRQCDQHQLF